MHFFRIGLCLLLVFHLGGTVPSQATEAAWARVATGGYTILLRHARTAGPGDPPGFDIADCATQNNLSDRGRQQASRIGARFAARAVAITRVYHSAWCRAAETASLAFGSTARETLEALNDLAADDAIAGAPEDVRDLVNGFRGPGNQVLITHPSVILALVDVEPREGEALILAAGAEDGAPQIVGRILLD
jgi:phosphohistidine phosphatase SixA